MRDSSIYFVSRLCFPLSGMQRDDIIRSDFPTYRYNGRVLHDQLRHFVPNLTFGAPIVACLRKHIPKIHFDCHLMVTYPRHYIEPLAKAGADCFTFHYESSYGDIRDVIKYLCRCAKS